MVYTNMDEASAIKENKDYYTEKGSDGFEKRQDHVDSAWFRAIAKKLSSGKKPGKALDVGCGTGLLLREFKKLGWEVHGADLSSYVQKYADMFGFTLHVGKIEEIDLPENSFDVITGINVIEHIRDPKPFIDKIIKLLKPGGAAYFNVPNYGSLPIRMGFSSFHRNNPPQHMSYYTGRTIRLLFNYSGQASMIEKIGVCSYGIPEMHRLMNYFNKKKKTKKNAASDKQPESRGLAAKTDYESASFFKRLVSNMQIWIYYLAGRPFSLGDKLEVMLVKKTG